MRDTTPRIGLIGPGLVIALLTMIGALLLMGAVPNVAVGQEPRLVGRLPEATKIEVDRILDAARLLGLPIEPLVDRALEGVAKGAPPALILSAVARLRDELKTARSAFGPAASVGEITAGASALRAGATSGDLAQLRRLRSGHQLTVAAAVLADLVTAGVPADTATGAVLALAGGVDDADYVSFRRSVQQDIALGASPAAALGVRLKSLVATADQVPNTTGLQNGRPKQKP